MPDIRYKEWQAPPAKAPEDKILGWLNEATEEGQNWLRSQRGYADFRKAMDVLAGRVDFPDLVNYRSKLNTNRLKRNVREVVGALANIRPWWGYHSENEAFQGPAEMMNKVTRAVYLESFFDRSIKEALQYAAATCTGWVRPVWRRGMAGKGKGHIELLTYGSPCVLPIQMPASNNFQESYAVTLLDEMPIFMAHAMFPKFQDRLHPTASKYWYSSEVRRSAMTNMWKRLFGSLFKRNADSLLSDLYVPIRYTYVLDLSLNRTGRMIPMGEPGSPWYYEVPAEGEMIPAGRDGEGTPVFREATENDARLYPYRRLIISSEDVITYDGPAFDWHGELPLIPFCVDDWPWEAIGFSLVHDGYEIQQSINEIERGTMDKVRASLDLPLGYDINAVTRREAMEFDPMQPRARIGYDGGLVEKPFAPPVPPEVYQIDPQVIGFRDSLQDVMDYQLAIRDVVSLAKARALGKGSDQLEALMEAQGPIVKDISRSMERSLARVGQQVKYLVLQYMDTRRLMQYVGPDDVLRHIMDYDPESIVPSHLPDEFPTGPDEKHGPSRYSRMERARWFADNLNFFIMPHSVHEITQMTYRLLLLQMRQRGLPIDSRTIAEACDVGNFGTKPEGNTVYERYWAEQEDQLLHMLRIQKIAASMGLDMGQMPGHGPTKSGSTHGKGGRPPSGQAAPQQAMKGDGRPVIKES